MDPAQAQNLRRLLTTQRVASLGTLHHGEPYVSMAPFALLPDGSAFVIHVSALSPHTNDMLASPRVSLMVVALQTPDVPSRALARVTVQGEAMPLPESDPMHADAKRAYLSRFPESTAMFELTDFSLFAIRPRSVRYIGGFAQASTISAATFSELMSGAADDGEHA